MSQLNIKGLIDNIKARTNVYTPLIEGIVNSIEAIDELNSQSGEIRIIIKRETSAGVLFDDNALPEISSVEIQDNGIGFNQQNRDSFDTLYSNLKIQKGGKGFGRFMFLKYFDTARIESFFEHEGKHFYRNFDFGKNEEIIENEKYGEELKVKNLGTTLFLERLQDKKMDKKVETIARKLVEKLLIYFIDDSYKCPKIVLQDTHENKEIVLNDYLKEGHGEIQEITSNSFVLEQSEEKQTFKFKVFKIFYPDNQKSKISLVAHKREVTETLIQEYIPEFSENFFDEVDEGKKKDFMIKTYVLGDYLNDHVSLERAAFNFGKKNSDALYPFSQHNIEKEAAARTKAAFPEEINSRQDKKKQIIHNYVNASAPWHRMYIEDLDLSYIPYNISDEGIEVELQRAKFHKEQSTKLQIKKILSEEDGDLEKQIDELIKAITDIGKSDLAHYVCNRKVVLDFFRKLLDRNDDGTAKYEKEVHNVIFPMGKDSTEIDYEEHNLWILDERLVFSQYIASDKKIAKQTSPTEPDLVIFDQKKSFRAGENEFSNPLTIFEFKRPKRENYTQDDDPVLQLGGYLDEIKAGKYETPKGAEKIKVNENTPVYGYVVCDITDKIKAFAKQNQLTMSADQEGYFGFHIGYKMYIEILSFKKLLKDAELRNRIFFKKLGLE